MCKMDSYRTQVCLSVARSFILSYRWVNTAGEVSVLVSDFQGKRTSVCVCEAIQINRLVQAVDHSVCTIQWYPLEPALRSVCRPILRMSCCLVGYWPVVALYSKQIHRYARYRFPLICMASVVQTPIYMKSLLEIIIYVATIHESYVALTLYYMLCKPFTYI